MVRIRLRRVGAKMQPSYRIVAADKESPRDGRFLEILGIYNPRTEPPTIKLKEERIYDWMNRGAQPSDSVMQIFRSVGLMDRYDVLKKGGAVKEPPAEAIKEETVREVKPKTTRKPRAKKAKEEKSS